MAEPSVVAYWGEDEFLLRLAAHELLAARGVHATEVDAAEWQGGETSDLSTPSLWGERRGLLVTRCQALPDGGARELAAYVADPAPDTLCVLTVVSRGKSPPPLVKAAQAGGGRTEQISLKRQDLPRWIMERARGRDLKLTGPGAQALVATLGEEAAALDQAVAQLASAFSGRSVGPEDVRSQFEGLGEQKVWDLCDRAFTGQTAQALVVLRSLLAAGEDPLPILGGIASRLRDLIRVRALPERMPPAEAAKAAGLRFDWQLRRYREQASRTTPEGLTALLDAVVDTDRALKGGTPGDVALAALVTALSGDPSATLDIPARVGR